MTDELSAPNTCLPRDLFLFPKQNAGFQIPYFLSTEEEAAKVRPPAVVKTLEQRLAELSEKERNALAELKGALQLTSWYDKTVHDDWMLIRYLSARNYDTKKSLAMLERSVQWRKENDVANWSCETCLKDPNLHLMQFVGWDFQYRPVCFMAMRWGPDRKDPLKHAVCTFNHMERLMPVGVEQWVCITDFETYSHIRDGNPKMGSTIINAIQDHFPERLGMMILVNAPTAFGFLWKLFSPVIDSKTKTKVRFLYTKSQSQFREEFAKLFPPDLCDYLCESYKRSKAAKLPTSSVWYPSAENGSSSNSVLNTEVTNVNENEIKISRT